MRPSISTILCKTLNQTLLQCYPSSMFAKPRAELLSSLPDLGCSGRKPWTFLVPCPRFWGRAFDFAFFSLLATLQKPFNPPTLPCDPQFRPFSAKHLTKPYFSAILPLCLPSPALNSCLLFPISGAPDVSPGRFWCPALDFGGGLLTLLFSRSSPRYRNRSTRLLCHATLNFDHSLQNT